ncbi:flagellar hook-length control protein FliK [Salinicola corii]|nr:flagellar hook-length control protein FliK [Salinicola corii]
MELSSINAVTPPSDRSASTRDKAATESVPFADSLRRVAAEKLPQPTAQGGASAQQAPSPDANGRPGEEVVDGAAQRPADESAAAGAGTSDATTASISQAPDEEDMSRLRAILSSLSPTAGDQSSGTKDVDEGSSAPDAEALAAMVAGLPLAMASHPLDPPAASGAGAALSRGEHPALAQLVLKATDTTPTANGAAVIGAPATEGDQVDASDRPKASSGQPGFGGLLSAIDSRHSDGAMPGANPGMTATPGAPDNAAVTTASQIGDAASIGLPERNAQDAGPVPTPRSDIGALTNATAAPSSAASPATASTATPGFVNAPVQSPQWPASFGQQVLQMHQRGDQQMSLRLHPQELGPLNVSLTVQDQQAQLQVLSAHAPVRAAVEAAIPQLRQALADSGIALGEAMVSDQGHFQQGQSSGDDHPHRRAGAAGSVLTASGIKSIDDVTVRSLTLTDNGNINLYA